MKTIHELIADYCAGSLTETEAADLRKQLESDAKAQRLFQEAREAETLLKMRAATNDLATTASWQALKKRMDTILRRKQRRTRMLAGTGIAALVALTVAVGTPLFRQSEPIPMAAVTPVIEPGSTKATLLMADGETIALDNLADDNITTSDGTVINHDNEGGLQYQQQAPPADTVVRYHTIRVPKGGEYRFTLPDGSFVCINSAAELRFPTRFRGEKREVYARGEIYFEVTPDRRHPFVVHSGDNTVRVLGTTFNVNAYPDEEQMVTTLVEGKVEFCHAGRNVPLQPGEQAVFNKTTETVETRSVDVSLYTAWVNGSFEYERMPLSSITRQLSRWYDVEFLFEAEEFRDHPFTGIARRDQSLDKILGTIAKTTGVAFEISDRKVYIKKRNLHFKNT
ncbi:MAG: DUF4974 domain-containing protein [Odoribacter sp.]|nr:DUF4974 domain-containing protein [Odoribacter sp.]